MLAWHFVGEKLRDGRPVPADGVTLRHDGPLVLCPRAHSLAKGEGGFHASWRLIDALKHARGSTICRVRMGSEAAEEHDKLVARERTILWRVQAEDLLLEFARRCASDVIQLWDAPDVVREFLQTGDESLREAALAAARSDAKAVRSAAWAAAWAAAGDARDAAWEAAWNAAWNAAEAAADAAAWETAYAAARAAQNARLTDMVLAEAERQGLEPLT